MKIYTLYADRATFTVEDTVEETNKYIKYNGLPNLGPDDILLVDDEYDKSFVFTFTSGSQPNTYYLQDTEVELTSDLLLQVVNCENHLVYSGGSVRVHDYDGNLVVYLGQLHNREVPIPRSESGDRVYYKDYMIWPAYDGYTVTTLDCVAIKENVEWHEVLNIVGYYD